MDWNEREDIKSLLLQMQHALMAEERRAEILESNPYAFADGYEDHTVKAYEKLNDVLNRIIDRRIVCLVEARAIVLNSDSEEESGSSPLADLMGTGVWVNPKHR